MPRTFLIDTDTASDDAVALIMALRAPDVRVAAITTGISRSGSKSYRRAKKRKCAGRSATGAGSKRCSRHCD